MLSTHGKQRLTAKSRDRQCLCVRHPEPPSHQCHDGMASSQARCVARRACSSDSQAWQTRRRASAPRVLDGLPGVAPPARIKTRRSPSHKASASTTACVSMRTAQPPDREPLQTPLHAMACMQKKKNGNPCPQTGAHQRRTCHHHSCVCDQQVPSHHQHKHRRA
jgi:hypothetical protein